MEPLKSSQYIKIKDKEQEYQFQIRELEAQVNRLKRRPGRKPAQFYRLKMKAEVSQKVSDNYELFSLESDGFKLVGKLSISTFTKAKFERSGLDAIPNL